MSDPILLVDSEATARAARVYLPEGWHVAMCDPSAISHETYSDYSHAVIWGRNDEGGKAWAEHVAEAVGVPCHVVTPPGTVPAHWDLSQPLIASHTPQMVTAYLGAMLGRCLTVAPRLQPALPIIVPVAIPAAPSYITTPGGQVRPLIANVVELLRTSQDAWDLRFDEFSNRPFLGAVPLTDSNMREIVVWVQEHGIHAGKDVVHEGILRVADMRNFHPVREYLESLEWDKIERLDHFLIDHGGAEADEWGLTAAMGRKWMIQAVARIYEPGCQADAMLILEGQQGLKKSSLFRQLFGDRWFTDHLPNLADKDAMLQLCGVWCVEVSELATLDRSDSAKIKQFLTSRIDRFRAPFGRLVADNPRTSVFGGTINPGAEGYLKDPTGGRRFWPIHVKERANIDAIAASRDQLWAEACARYKAGEMWWIDESDAELYEAVTQRQRDRYDDDPWTESIADYLRGRASATMADIFRFALNMSTTADWSRAEQLRISRVLTLLNWSRRRVREGKKLSWKYMAPMGGAAAVDDDQESLPLE